jgi:hypothetical protein
MTTSLPLHSFEVTMAATMLSPRAGGDQREPSSPSFEPRPLFLSGRGSKLGTPTAAQKQPT